IGRAIMPQDEVQGAPLVAVISHGLWQRAFGSDPAVAGRVVQINGRNANVAGVMPPGFTFPPGELDPREVWVPIQLGPPDQRRRGSHFLYLIGRLKPGVPLRQAQDEIARHVRQSEDRWGRGNHPFSPKEHPIVSYPLHGEVVRSVRPALWTLMGAVAFVLLIACVNVANLLLARAEARQREIAIRKALGAGLGQLIRQFTTEGLLLSLAGAAVGLALALALVLLIGTGLMIRAFWKLSEVHPGFRADGLLTLRVNLPQALYPDTASVQRFWQAVQGKLSGIPGVESATAMNGLPPERPINANDTYIEGFTAVPNGPGHNIDYWQSAGDRFFETMGIRLMEGRVFDSRDG